VSATPTEPGVENGFQCLEKVKAEVKVEQIRTWATLNLNLNLNLDLNLLRSLRPCRMNFLNVLFGLSRFVPGNQSFFPLPSSKAKVTTI